MSASGTKVKSPLQRALEESLGQEILPEELEEAKWRLTQIAGVLSAIGDRRSAANRENPPTGEPPIPPVS